jgi:hypothetical protein
MFGTVPSSGASFQSAASDSSVFRAEHPNTTADAAAARTDGGQPPAATAPAPSPAAAPGGLPSADPAPDEEWDLAQLDEWFGDSGFSVPVHHSFIACSRLSARLPLFLCLP